VKDDEWNKSKSVETSGVDGNCAFPDNPLRKQQSGAGKYRE